MPRPKNLVDLHERVHPILKVGAEARVLYVEVSVAEMEVSESPRVFAGQNVERGWQSSAPGS